MQCSHRFFTSFGALPRSPDIPQITEAQAEALDALPFFVDSFHIILDFRNGDKQYDILHQQPKHPSP